MSTALGQDVPQTALLIVHLLYFCLSQKPFSGFEAHLQSLTGWGTNNSEGLMHGKESCQAGTLSHENKLHKSFTRHLFYVPAIHRTSGLMSEYLIQSDNCQGRRKAAGFSHRERKYRINIQLLMNKSILTRITHTLQHRCKREFTIGK